jgi:hypothetical protein
MRNYFNGGQRLQRYLKIIKNIFADAWWHLVWQHFVYISHICKFELCEHQIFNDISFLKVCLGRGVNPKSFGYFHFSFTLLLKYRSSPCKDHKNGEIELFIYNMSMVRVIFTATKNGEIELFICYMSMVWVILTWKHGEIELFLCNMCMVWA